MFLWCRFFEGFFETLETEKSKETVFGLIQKKGILNDTRESKEKKKVGKQNSSLKNPHKKQNQEN